MEDYIISHGSSVSPPFINAATAYKLLNVPTLMSELETGLRNFSAGEAGGVVMPVRTVIPVGDESGALAVMPAYSCQDSGLAVKLVSVFPGNAQRGLPSHSAMIVLFNAATGEVLSLIDGGVITAMRTAAVSALAIRRFSSTRSGKVAIIGSGVQARSHLLVLRHVFDVKEVRIYSRTKENAQKFASQVTEPVSVCDTVKEAVEDADVIVTTTMAKEPIVFGDWVKKGAVVAAVGAYKPTDRELDETLMESAAVIVDSRPGALKESGAVRMSKAEIRAELGEVLATPAGEPGVVQSGETVVFKNLGLAIEDVVAAKHIYEKYQAEKEAGAKRVMVCVGGVCRLE
ncbi:ketimine reductase mu-crystallin-like isoform X1 [Sycon ciliatum]|uniref:ketimine reductase mu-crystallin-like isoform X1 n=1 Tax=Sycon ciliatum TaxID=27933 RepID=UPI0031F6E2C2